MPEFLIEHHRQITIVLTSVQLFLFSLTTILLFLARRNWRASEEKFKKAEATFAEAEVEYAEAMVRFLEEVKAQKAAERELFQYQITDGGALDQFRSDCAEAVRYMPLGEARDRFREMIDDMDRLRRSGYSEPMKN